MDTQKFSEINDFIKKDAHRLLIEVARLEGIMSAVGSYLDYDDDERMQNELMFDRLNSFLTLFV